MTIPLQPGDALLLVDVQIDFCPGGALPVPGGDEIVPLLNEWIDAAAARGCPVFASRDWHPADHVSFASRGGPWPVHCVCETPGAQLHPDLRLPRDAVIIDKATERDVEAYSAFEGTDLAAQLHGAGVRRLWIGGLALDVCVKATALDARRAGFEVLLIPGATRAVNAAPGDEERALDELAAAGVHGAEVSA